MDVGRGDVAAEFRSLELAAFEYAAAPVTNHGIIIVNPEDAVDFGREALRTCLMVGGPVLLVGLIIGLVTGVLQAMTQVQDQTVSFVPKILLMFVAIGLALPWLAEQMMDFAKQSFETPMMSFSQQAESAPDFNSPTEAFDEEDVPTEYDASLARDYPATMPTLQQKYTMPNLQNRPVSSMPIFGGSRRAIGEVPRVADSSDLKEDH